MTVAPVSHMRSHLRRQNASQNGRSASLSVEVIKKELPKPLLAVLTAHRRYARAGVTL